MKRKYPSKVPALLNTGLLNNQTKKVLQERLDQLNEIYRPEFFDNETFHLLKIIADVIIPQEDQDYYIDLAASIDRRLNENKNNGWRFASMPPDGEAYKQGLNLINDYSLEKFNKNFTALDISSKQNLLMQLQQKRSKQINSSQVSADLFFEELLAELTEAYYSHPLVQDELGYVGMADTNGWRDISLNNRDPHEPVEMNSANRKEK